MPKCYEAEECFGKKSRKTGKVTDNCHILLDTYPKKTCPFKKPERSWTNGVHYMHKYND